MMKTMSRNSAYLIFVGLVLALMLNSGSAIASPLAAFTDHTAEDHSFENHFLANLEGITLTGTDLTDTSFKNAILTNAIMISAILTDAVLFNADLTGADLTDALMSGVAAKNANFTNATLDGAYFAMGDIKGATFVGASLLGTDLSSLTNANKADFTGAFYDENTLLAPGMDTLGMSFIPEPSSALLLLFGLLGLQVCSSWIERS